MQRPEYKMQFTYMQTLDYAKACNDYIDHLEQQLAELKSSLPKVRAEAFQAGAEWCETSISSWRVGQAADIYADKLEAGNE